MKTPNIIISLILVVVLVFCLPFTAIAVVDNDCVYIETGEETHTGYTYKYDTSNGIDGEFLHLKIRDESKQSVFNIEPNVGFANTYYKNDKANTNEYWNQLSDGQKEGIILSMIYFYQYSDKGNDAYAATQAVIWEFVTGARKSFSELDIYNPDCNIWYDAIKGTSAEIHYLCITRIIPQLSSYRYYVRDILVNSDYTAVLSSATEFSEPTLLWLENSNFDFMGLFTIVGDVNRDGRVNIKDATAIQKHLARISTLDDVALSLADTDENGRVTIKDSTNIQKYLAGYDLTLPPLK